MLIKPLVSYCRETIGQQINRSEQYIQVKSFKFYTVFDLLKVIRGEGLSGLSGVILVCLAYILSYNHSRPLG